MVGALLLRGMLAGLLAGLLVFAFARVAGEPSVDRAIAFESAHDAAEHAHAHGAAPAAPVAEEPELVSRPTQAGLGLLTATTTFGTALGGLFALTFAAAAGRLTRLPPRPAALALAGAAFVALALVPALKYPANPPAIGEPGTIGLRTALYFTLLALSILAMLAAATLRTRLTPRHGTWNAGLASAGTYVAIMAIAAAVLPAVNEVPDGFPADTLWSFRLAALGMQAILWTAIGLAFGPLAERALAAPQPGTPVLDAGGR